MFLHNLGVLNSIFGDILLQISETEIGRQNVKKPPGRIFYDLSHMKSQFMVSVFSSIFGKKINLIDFQMQDVRRFYIFTVTISITLHMLTII